MTWWDHESESVWSQPWGRAIAGPLKGIELELLPSELVPWETWREAHPNTLALKTHNQGVRGGVHFLAPFQPYYVIGVPLGDHATAFLYQVAADAGIINDSVGRYPIVVHVDPDAKRVNVLLRQVDEQTLTFSAEGGVVRDAETGSTWAMETGVAVDGPMQGQVLRSVPYVPAYDSAWEDFYPQSRWYGQ
jgi:hypothetical protein